MKRREPRRDVCIPARMQCGATWSDIVIRNMSNRGLMAEMAEPPKAGSYVDVRRGTQVIIGRVVWRNGPRFGVLTQDRVEIDAIVDEPRLAQRPAASTRGAPDAGERRSALRASSADQAAERLERSRRISGALQFMAIVIVATLAAGFTAMEVYKALARPLSVVGDHLAPAG